jgi:hypothetical protein
MAHFITNEELFSALNQQMNLKVTKELIFGLNT